MKIQIIKEFRKGELHAEKGDILEVGANLGHGLIDSGLAFKVFDNVKEVFAPEKNKMMSKTRGRKKIITK
jgi:hypothetical protein